MKLLASEKLHPRCIVTSAYFFFLDEDFFAADFDFDADLPAFFLAAMRFHLRSKFVSCSSHEKLNLVLATNILGLSRSFCFRLIKIAIKNIRKLSCSHRTALA
jgi:hypothetical protein